MAAVRLVGYVVADTNRAIFFHDHYWSGPDWLPKSQIDVSRNSDTSEVSLIASDWISKQKGLREFQYREIETEAATDAE